MAVTLAGCKKQVTTQSTGEQSTTQEQSSPAANPNAGEVKAGSSITIENFAFSPTSLVVKAGETVSVTNKDSVAHTATSADGGQLFDTGMIKQSETKTFTAPTIPGTYIYTCTPHPNMTGTLIVQ